MDKKLKLFLIAVAAVVLATVLFFMVIKYFDSEESDESWIERIKDNLVSQDEDSEKISDVKTINGLPKLFINNKEMNSSAVNVYYYPPQGENNVPGYNDPEWLANMKKLIDRAISNNTQLVLLNTWWSDLDQSKSRPKNISDNLNFAPLDSVFEYAQQKNVYLMPIFTLFPFDPDWWLKENNFPPYDKGKICDFCETDSVGNVYNNASMNSEIVQRDFGAFVEAVIKHYKNNPALAGWNMGAGATGEDGYGPNYIVIRNPGNIDGLAKIESQSAMYTDYSPYFERKFREWLKKKYGSDAKIQAAWNNNSLNLASIEIPQPQEMFKDGEALPARFPDPTDIFAIATNEDKKGKEALNSKGLDFYNFRNDMRDKERKFYAELIKKNDPGHVLFFAGSSEDILSQSEIDFEGITFSIGMAEAESYYFGTNIAKIAVKYGKIAVLSDEHPCDSAYAQTGKCERFGQVNFLESLGKIIKCAGGIFAYVDAPYGKNYFSNRSAWIPPMWFTDEAMSAAKKTGNFQSSEDCACSMAQEILSLYRCGNGNSERGCDWLVKISELFCGEKATDIKADAKDSPAQNSNVVGSCGDKTCDAFEKSSGKCPVDCE